MFNCCIQQTPENEKIATVLFDTASSNGVQTVEDTENMITQGLLDMSLGEREDAIAEIYGFERKELFEDTENISRSFREVDFHLSTSQSEALRIAWKEDKGQYLQSLYLRFLRCFKFDSKSIVKHCELKRELFGGDRLCRHITLDDLSKSDMAFLKAGAYQVLPRRDRSGRVVFVSFMFSQKYKEPANVVSVGGYCTADDACCDLILLCLYSVASFLLSQYGNGHRR